MARRSGVLALVALAACGRGAAKAPAAAEGVASLRVLTYNVYVGNRDPVGTAALIRKADADVIVLQETTPALAGVLRRELADRYPYMAFHVGPLGNGPGVIARSTPAGATYLPSGVGMNGFWIGTFTIGGHRLQVVDVHLHPSEFGSWSPLDAKRAYDRAEQVRVAQVDELRPHLAPDVPTVLIGDFNSLPGSPTLARFEALGWRDGLAGTDAATAPTYEIRGLGFHIDHVLVPPGVSCATPGVLRAGTSDHFPVTATLSWPVAP